MPVAVQITVLLALSARLFDDVPLARMDEAESVLREAAAAIPSAVYQRFATATHLEDEDRDVILQIARRALAPFVVQADAGSAS